MGMGWESVVRPDVTVMTAFVTMLTLFSFSVSTVTLLCSLILYHEMSFMSILGSRGLYVHIFP